MLDSGSAVSLVRGEEIGSVRKRVKSTQSKPQLRLVTASGDPLPIIDHITASVQIGQLKVTHNFAVVHKLVTPAILGIDFLRLHGLILDFTSVPVTVRRAWPESLSQGEVMPILEAERKIRYQACSITALEDVEPDIDECIVPKFSDSMIIELPECPRLNLAPMVHKFEHLFRTVPGSTSVAYHYIPTKGTPVRVPPRRIPAHYKAEIEQQIQDMLRQGIIEVSSSPWMAPAVFVRKKSGEIRLCIDYRELNKQTTKDAYPLPLPDEVQDQLSSSTVFSTLDLQSGYWQVPVNPADMEKTAFCPGPGMGLFQFRRMPFGLSGAPGSFQRIMDTILRDLPFVTTYIDDILVHSATEELHQDHLQQVFQRLADAGLTLRGRKCHIGLSSVSYLGHVFSGQGMSPDPQKVQSVENWAIPTDVTTLRRFLGLASYYRRYIARFADIAAPLHNLTQKGITFHWTPECEQAFFILKEKLVQAPILTFPKFDEGADMFELQTDASAVGVGAILEQGGHVVAYASRALTKAERQYSVIQRECLAAVYAMKQFRHYLLGRKFKLMTDHAPLQWLSAQKMEGLLCRWALAIQEYDFSIVYRKGSLNVNADSLSRQVPDPPIMTPLAATSMVPGESKDEIRRAQQADPTIQQIHTALSASESHPTGSHWRGPSLRRYRQLWSQLILMDGVLCRQYAPGPTSDVITVPILPPSLRQQALHVNHDSPSAGHLGMEKTLQRLRKEAYWVGMAADVHRYCQECSRCQQSKLPMPTRAPLTSIPIGNPWQMIAVDVLQVPLSSQNHKYLLVIQDYFTKWGEAIPMADQTAQRITTELVKLCSTLGLPEIVHSDQGRNFESTILQQTLQAFGVKKSRTTAYHPQGDGMVERLNRSLLQLLRTYVTHEDDWERHLPLVLYAYRTSPHTSTGVSPFELMFGRQPKPSEFSPPQAFEPASYQAHLQAKLAALRDLVEANATEAAATQKGSYDRLSQKRVFRQGDPVWLSLPTAGKLSPRWEGRWTVKAVKSPVTMEVTTGDQTKVVHINRLRHRIQPQPEAAQNMKTPPQMQWIPPQVDHLIIPSADPPATHRYPQRLRRPPDRLY